MVQPLCYIKERTYKLTIMEEFLRNMPQEILVTGIGTDVGKSYATGWIAKQLLKDKTYANDKREAVITQKLIQTGNAGMSEDIEVHRNIMGTGMLPRDIDHTTAPIILSYPASPELAARLDKAEVDFGIAAKSTEILNKEYKHVLIEGAGGLLVPLHKRYMTLDYIKEHTLPVIVVTNGQLGSINHTLLTLEVLKNNNVKVYAIIYNPHFDKDKIISSDTVTYISEWIQEYLPKTYFVKMPETIL